MMRTTNVTTMDAAEVSRAQGTRPMTVKGLLSAVSVAVLITNLGAIASAQGVSAAAERCHARVIDMGTLGGSSSEILESNNRGVWVGTSRDAGEVHKAVIWENGQIRDLGTVGEAEGDDINNNGIAVGNHKLDENLTARAWIWRDGVLRELTPLPAGGPTFVRRLNDRGDVAGSALDAEGVEHPVVWRAGATR